MLPSNGFAACGSLWRTVDLMWSAAGDEARDASYYTKRSLLAAVWTSTFLFWLDDRSQDFGAPGRSSTDASTTSCRSAGCAPASMISSRASAASTR